LDDIIKEQDEVIWKLESEVSEVNRLLSCCIEYFCPQGVLWNEIAAMRVLSWQWQIRGHQWVGVSHEFSLASM